MKMAVFVVEMLVIAAGSIAWLVRAAQRGAALWKKEGRQRTGQTARLLTETEALFYPVLRRAAGSCPVMVKVRLMDATPDIGGDAYALGTRMRQHLDFVVVDPATWRVLCAVELDDASHQTRDARRRDAVKDEALAAGGVPLVRVRTAGHYDAGQIAARLSPYLTAAGLDTPVVGGGAGRHLNPPAG